MTRERRAALEAAGVDVDQALERMMGSEALLERLLGKFLEDTQFTALRSALDAGDGAGAVVASHALKGVCGNLSMTRLFGLFTRQVEALRRGETAEALSLMEEIGPAYDDVRAAIIGGGADGR